VSDSKIFRGALAWSFLLNGARQGLTSLFTLALAAVLGPEDFGAVTIALTMILFFQLFLDNGLSDAIVQRKDLDDEHLTAAFWILSLSGLGLAAVSLALARWWAAANHLPDLVPVIAALTLILPLQALGVVQQALLRRRMDFRSLAVLANLAVIAAGVLGLVLAHQGFGVWALVVYQLTVPFATLVLYWVFTRWRPALGFRAAAARDLFHVSSGSILAGLGTFVNVRADALVMGLLFGPAAVGAYRLAERLVALVIETAARPVQAVALPEFARLQESRDELAAAALRCIRIAGVLTVAPLAVLAVGAHEATALVGPKWQDAAGALAFLGAAGAARSLVLFLGPLLVGIGRPHALAALLWGTALPSAAAACVAAWLVRDASTAGQAAGIGASRAILYLLIFFPIAIEVGRRTTGLRPARVLAALTPSLGAAAVGVLAVLALRGVPGLSGLPAREGASLVLAGGGAAAAIALYLLDSALRDELQRLRRVAWAK
jgi:O-antigen/teichoic acid export membrane protein